MYKYTDKGRKHLHSLDDKPLIGTSAVVRIIGKGDALVQWSANCAVDHLEKVDWFREIMDPEYLKDVFNEARVAWKTKRDASAEKGTERHSNLEEYVRDCLAVGGIPVTGKNYPEIKEFVDWAQSNVARFLFTEANCYSTELWLGGIADIGIEMRDGKRLLGDHKSSPKAYFSQIVQCALYDIELSENGGRTPEGEKVFDWAPADGYVIFPFRSVPFTPEFVWATDEYKEAAKAAVTLYKLSQTRE